MAQATTIRGGAVAVMLGDNASPIVYSSPCGFTQRSVTLNKALEEFQIPDCSDPDAVDWLGRDAASLSMSVNGEGVLAEESVEDWLDAWESTVSVPVKIVWTFPATTITWTGNMHVENIEVTAPNARRVTATISMQSDGEMTRAVS